VTPAPARPGRWFAYAEFVGRGGCGPLTPQQRRALHDLCHRFLDPLRDRFGVTVVLSGCRSEDHNRAVGGAPDSFHMYAHHPGAVAADVRCATGRPADWHRFLDELGAGGLGAYPTHVHVDNRRQHARW
jgi:uncharacterized protein YcbK (DUF882 family)